jgi:hypothetical protein
MSTLTDLQAEQAAIQAQINILTAVPEDTFHFGTIVLFAAAHSVKWYIVKVGEELWSKLSSEGGERDLASWFLEAAESHIGYFEAYEMTVAETPFHTYTPPQ